MMAKKPAGKKLPPWMMEDKDEIMEGKHPMNKKEMPKGKKGSKKMPCKK
jgi:hypothetical protein